MASKNVPKHWNEKSQAQLMEAFQEHFRHQQYLWREGAAKRELISRMLLKLTKDDPVVDRLMKETEEKTLALSKQPLLKPHLTKTEVSVRLHNEDFAATSIHLVNPWQLSWTSIPTPGDVYADTSGSMGFGLTTDGAESEACAMALGDWFQPSPGSSQMTVSVNADITYTYGNHAFLQSAHTHAWIGLYIQESDPETDVIVQTNVRQMINLWDYTHDSDLGNNLPHSFPVSATIASVPEHVYAIWLWAGGDVESSGLSYGNLSVQMTDMFIRLA
jgi:hypothetical protein